MRANQWNIGDFGASALNPQTTTADFGRLAMQGARPGGNMRLGGKVPVWGGGNVPMPPGGGGGAGGNMADVISRKLDSRMGGGGGADDYSKMTLDQRKKAAQLPEDSIFRSAPMTGMGGGGSTYQGGRWG